MANAVNERQQVPEGIRAVIFDLSGVITVDMGKGLSKLNALFGTHVPEWRLAEIWRPLYISASLGQISADELWDRLRQGLAPGSASSGKEEATWLAGITLREPDVADTLAQLRKEYALGLMSNHVGRWARALLDRYDLTRYLDAVLISSDVGVRKPDPLPLRLICELMRVAPPEAVYVADEEEDLEAAQALGMFPIFIPGEDASSRIGLQIEAVSDLLRVLQTTCQ